PELEAVLQKDEMAWDQWTRFNYTHKKEYVEWITDAKKEETRKRRIAQAFQMIREGEGKEDKYREAKKA
ncbi:MAG: YdeI/OmpD-associated family protein, partial [Flavobacteriales bacterium]|nr:YdeI/OmpD-associated family protein [Flavobacteriales bacterium]